MVVKKKPVKASAPLEEAVAKEENHPPITQVVEVVEETPVEVGKPLEVPAAPIESIATPPSVTEVLPVSPVEEKRKEMVDELFQNKPQSPPTVMPEISVHTHKSSKPIYLWAIVLIVACLVVGVSLLLFSGKKGLLPSIVSVPTPTASPTAKVTVSPTPSETDRSSITIQVLNGGGKAGAATKMKTTLEEKGYTVSDTGNADSYTYDKTEIMVKSSKKAYIPLLEADLGDVYSLGTSSSTLEDTVSYDVRVIVGKE